MQSGIVPWPRPDAGAAGLPIGSDTAIVLATLAAMFALHHATVAAMADIWLHSQTFAHGLIIGPISAWLVWRRRGQLTTLPRRPSATVLWALTALGAGWLLATVANVAVLQQYLMVAMVPAAVAAVLGGACARAIAFPLAYLLLAVPFGEIFVPPLVDFTAGFTINALQLSGIAAYRENNFLSLPSGNWSVVDACSGLRYVIASLALGTLYAYLTYRSRWRRLLFIGVALVLPVFANGLRAYGIVLLGHWSSMRLATGVDHLIYGWVFFCLISLLQFWAGSYWRESPPDAVASTPRLPATAPTAGLARAAVACVAITACAPLLAALILRADRPPTHADAAVLTLPALPAPWRASALDDNDSHVLHAGQPRRYAAKLSDGATSVTLQLSSYARQRKDEELLTPVRRSIQAGQPQWHDIGSSVRRIALGGRGIDVIETVVQAGDVKLLVWHWYRQGGVDTASAFDVKLRLAAIDAGLRDAAPVINSGTVGSERQRRTRCSATTPRASAVSTGCSC